MNTHRKTFWAAAATFALCSLFVATPASADTGDQSFDEIAAANQAAALQIDPATWDGVAESTTELVVSGTTEGGEGQRSTVYNVVCVATADAVHKSEGAGGAIYKTRVTCTGTGLTAVTVRVKGGISFASAPVDNGSAGPWTVRATSDYNQVITVNGAAKTFYTPQTGSGGYGTGYWTGTSTFQIIAPAAGTIGTVQSLTWRTIS